MISVYFLVVFFFSFFSDLLVEDYCIKPGQFSLLNEMLTTGNWISWRINSL